ERPGRMETSPLLATWLRILVHLCRWLHRRATLRTCQYLLCGCDMAADIGPFVVCSISTAPTTRMLFGGKTTMPSSSLIAYRAARRSGNGPQVDRHHAHGGDGAGSGLHRGRVAADRRGGPAGWPPGARTRRGRTAVARGQRAVAVKVLSPHPKTIVTLIYGIPSKETKASNAPSFGFDGRIYDIGAARSRISITVLVAAN